MNEFKITYENGFSEIAYMNATLEEAVGYYVGSYWPVIPGKRPVLAVCVEINEPEHTFCRELDEGPTVQCPAY